MRTTKNFEKISKPRSTEDADNATTKTSKNTHPDNKDLELKEIYRIINKYTDSKSI